MYDVFPWLRAPAPSPFRNFAQPGAGGSGIVPLMAMIRHRAVRASTVPTRLLYSSREFDQIIYRRELAQLDWTGYRRRIDQAMLAEVAWPPSEQPQAFVCGPTSLVETVASALVDLGHDPLRVKTERFGASGGTA
jgi:ferredoxin-NADP reductase